MKQSVKFFCTGLVDFYGTSRKTLSLKNSLRKLSSSIEESAADQTTQANSQLSMDSSATAEGAEPRSIIDINKEKTLKEKAKKADKKAKGKKPYPSISILDYLGKNEVSLVMGIRGQPRNPKPYILHDKEFRYRHPFLENEVRTIFKTREKIISYLHRYLRNMKFIKVKTSMTMAKFSCEASCGPFFLDLEKDLNVKLYTRCTPELYLKSHVTEDGFNRVYEISKQIQDEVIDMTCNLEFTTCNFYMAFAYYDKLMKLSEDMLSGMVKELTGGYKIKYHANGFDKEPIEIDFTPPFRRISLIEELEKVARLNIPKDLLSEEANMYLIDACARLGVECPPPLTTDRLLHTLVGEFLEVRCVNPTFIIDYPVMMSPFARLHISKEGLTESFVMYINKHEVCNGYTGWNVSLNESRFADLILKGDVAVLEELSEQFCQGSTHKYPKAGCGLGIDGLTMLLADSHNIKDVIFSPRNKLAAAEATSQTY